MWNLQNFFQYLRCGKSVFVGHCRPHMQLIVKITVIYHGHVPYKNILKFAGVKLAQM